MQLRLTPWVRGLLIAFAVGYVSTRVVGTGEGLQALAWVPTRFLVKYDIWTLLTFGFIHGDVFHLFFNSLMLVMIGADLEPRLGGPKLFCLWILGQAGAALAAFVLSTVLTPGTPWVVLGSSGGLYALLWVYVKMFSDRQFLFLFFFSVSAKAFLALVLAIETLTLLSAQSGMVASLAHLGGLGFGALYCWWTTRTPRPKKRPKHLRLVVPKENPKYWN